jgi:hypothetical protein
MIPIKHIDPDDLALYAMQLLPHEEMDEISLHLQYSSEARRVLSEMYGDLSLLAHSAEMHEAPAEARQRLMKNVAREKKVVPIDRTPTVDYAPRTTPSLFEQEPAQKSLGAKILPWAGWAIAAGLAFGTEVLYQQREQLKSTVASNTAQMRKTQSSAELASLVMDTVKDPTALHVTLTATGAKAPPAGRISYVTDKGSLVLLASNLEPLQPNKIYELWLLPANGQPAMPAGTFKPDAHGNASLLLPQLPKGITAKGFGVTIEEGEGGPLPTLPIVLSGQAS